MSEFGGLFYAEVSHGRCHSRPIAYKLENQKVSEQERNAERSLQKQKRDLTNADPRANSILKVHLGSCPGLSGAAEGFRVLPCL